MTSPECPVCLDPLEGPGVKTIPCCRQMIHTKCYLDMVLFYEGRRRDTPCPLCRAVLSEYVAIDVEEPEEAEDTDPGPSPTKRLAVFGTLLAFQASFLLIYRFAFH